MGHSMFPGGDHLSLHRTYKYIYTSWKTKLSALRTYNVMEQLIEVFPREPRDDGKDKHGSLKM